MTYLRAIGLLLLMLACTCIAGAQPHGPYSKLNLRTEVRLHYGVLWPHHLELQRFNAHYPAVELSVYQQTWGRHRWEEAYAYPSYGISLWMSNLGGFEELGSAYALYPYMSFPLTRDPDHRLHFRLGVGLAYLTNHFDRINNYQNFAIGSALNLAGSIYFDYRWRVSKRIIVSAGGGLTHFSNGSTRTPNYGLNIITLTAGVSANLGRPNPMMKKQLLPRHYPFEFDGSQYLEIQVAGALANKDMTEQLGQRFMAWALYTNTMFRVSYKSKVGAGLDYTHDGSDVYILRQLTGKEPTIREVTKVGFSGAYELVIDRMSFLFNMGINIAGKEHSEGDFFQRLTLKYHLTEDLFANMALSAHLGKAEYIGLGIGYRFMIKYRQRVPHD